jgi:hypothetical protein
MGEGYMSGLEVLAEVQLREACKDGGEVERFVIEHGIWVWGPLRRTARWVYLFSDCVILFISVTIVPQNALVILWSCAEELRQYDTD